MKFQTWQLYVVLAGLAWGTYVPIIFYGGSELGGKSGSRLMAILCVGTAYCLIGVVFPLILFLTGQEQWPDLKTTGIVFSSLAGVAGAVGAICVIFASKSAVEAAKVEGVMPATYRMYIAPLIFGLAPLINTLVSLVWHPKPGNPFHFDIKLPGLWPTLSLVGGIILVSAGTFFVLLSKELMESAPKPRPAPAQASLQPPDKT